MNPNNKKEVQKVIDEGVQFEADKEAFLKSPHATWYREVLEKSKQELLERLSIKTKRPNLEAEMFYLYGRLDQINDQLTELS